jgi:hypothetical protein
MVISRSRVVITLAFCLASGCVSRRSAEMRIDDAFRLRPTQPLQALNDLRTLLASEAIDPSLELDARFLAADLLLDLGRKAEAVAEARKGLAIPVSEKKEANNSETEPTPKSLLALRAKLANVRRPYFQALLALDGGDVSLAMQHLSTLMRGGYRNIPEFFKASWLEPIRSHPSYRVLVASIVLNAGALTAGDAQLIANAGGIKLQPLAVTMAAPGPEGAGQCSLAVVQLREQHASSPNGLTQVVGEGREPPR